MGPGRGRPGIPRIPRPPFNPGTHAFCTHCRQVKSRIDFPKNKNNPNGLHCWCLECNNSAARAWENDPANYRRRRDLQALNARAYHSRVRGTPLAKGPIEVRQTIPPALRAGVRA